jgi:hypothetical protein
MVIGDTTHSSHPASFVWDVAELLLVSIPIAEQALVNPWTVMHGVPTPFAPLAALVVLFGAMFPPVHKVVEASIEHSARDIWGRQGIVEDAWLEAAEGVSASEGL